MLGGVEASSAAATTVFSGELAAAAMRRRRRDRGNRSSLLNAGTARVALLAAVVLFAAGAIPRAALAAPVVVGNVDSVPPTRRFTPNVLWKYSKDLERWVELDAAQTKQALKRFPSAIMAHDSVVLKPGESLSGSGFSGDSVFGTLENIDGAHGPGSELFDRDSAPNSVQASPWEEPSMGTYLLSKIGETSVFAVALTRRVVFERFYFNLLNWVYVRHLVDYPFGSTAAPIATCITHQGRLFVIDTLGQIIERRRNANDELEWYLEKPKEDLRVRGPGVASSVPGSRTMFFSPKVAKFSFASSSIRTFPSYIRFPSKRKAPCSGLLFRRRTTTLSLSSMRTPSAMIPCFCVTSRGEVVELSLESRPARFHNHKSPRGTIVSPIAGVAIKDGETGVGSLFVRTEMGTLAELWWDPEQGIFVWIEHGSPGKGVYVASPPGAVINDRSMFVVTSEATLAERYWDGKKWLWVEHGSPELVRGTSLVPMSLARVRGVALDSRTLYFMLTTGQLAKRMWDSTKWVWIIYEVPETGQAPYCVGDRSSPYSCMPVDVRIHDVTRAVRDDL